MALHSASAGNRRRKDYLSRASGAAMRLPDLFLAISPISATMADPPAAARPEYDPVPSIFQGLATSYVARCTARGRARRCSRAALCNLWSLFWAGLSRKELPWPANQTRQELPHIGTEYACETGYLCSPQGTACSTLAILATAFSTFVVPERRSHVAGMGLYTLRAPGHEGKKVAQSSAWRLTGSVF